MRHVKYVTVEAKIRYRSLIIPKVPRRNRRFTISDYDGMRIKYVLYVSNVLSFSEK
jgi:hypothetical protein